MSSAFSPCFDETLSHIGVVDVDLARRPGSREVMISRMTGSESELCVELEPADGDAFSALVSRDEAQLQELREGDIVFVAARAA